MFGELTPPEQQRIAQAYMPQMGGRSQADVGTLVTQLAANPDLAAKAMAAYESMSGNNSVSGGNGGPGSRINDLLGGMMAQDGTPDANIPTPPARPANVAVASGNPSNIAPPVRPPVLGGDDRVALAGGPGSPRGNAVPSGDPTQIAEGAVDPSMSAIIMSVLGGAGAAAGGYALGKGGPKQMPALPDGGAGVPPLQQAPKMLPPAAGGTAVAPRDKFAAAFGDDIPDAEYTEVKPKQVAETKKLTGPKEVDDRDNVKKADGKTIQADDATDEAGVGRTLNKGKATTVKEKLKAKVKVK